MFVFQCEKVRKLGLIVKDFLICINCGKPLKIKKISKEQEAILDAFKNVAQERRNSKKAE